MGEINSLMANTHQCFLYVFITLGGYLNNKYKQMGDKNYILQNIRPQTSITKTMFIVAHASNMGEMMVLNNFG